MEVHKGDEIVCKKDGNFQVFRNGKLYDTLPLKDCSPLKICRSLAESFPEDTWKAKDDLGEFFAISIKGYVPHEQK